MRIPRGLATGLAVGLAGVCSSPPVVVAATPARGLPAFEGLGDLAGGPFTSFANAVSADGSTVVGASASSVAANSFEAFRWTVAEGMVGLGDLGSAFIDSDARGVSGNGAIVVGEATPDSAIGSVPFRWSAGPGLVALVDSGGATRRGQAFDVSNDGSVIVGVGLLSGPNEPFRWTAATGMVGLGWLPGVIQDGFAFGTSGDGGVVCGISFSGPGADVETFRWTESTGMVGMGDVPGGVFYAIAWDVSDDGSTIVGEARATSGNEEMFVWRTETGFVLPDSLHGATIYSSAQAVSADGSVAVGVGAGGAMIWDAGHGMRSLTDVLTGELGVDLDDWVLSAATGVSADGRTIVGNGQHPNGDREAWIARLPAAVGVPRPVAPAGLALVPTGPNPFVSRAAFRLTVPPGGRRVRAAVHGADGRLVRILLDGELAAGPHPIVWDGRSRSGRRTAPGVYFLRVEAGTESCQRNLVRIP